MIRGMTVKKASTKRKECPEHGVPDEETVKDTLEWFEKEGMVFKTWDIKKQDYVWHKTEYGRKIAREMGWKEDEEEKS